ncbi:MAG TPA: type II secretion system protein GspM [Roseiarcus sp.]
MVYVGVVIALLSISLLLVADLSDKAAELAAVQKRLDQLSERPQPNQSASIGSNAGVNGSPFLNGQTITIAGAALQQRLEAAIAKADGVLMSSEVDLEGPDAKNGFVGLTANMEVSEPAVQTILYDIEAGMPFLVVDKVSIQSPEVFGEPETGRTRMTIGVVGQWRSSE